MVVMLLATEMLSPIVTRLRVTVILFSFLSISSERITIGAHIFASSGEPAGKVKEMEAKLEFTSPMMAEKNSALSKLLLRMSHLHTCIT